MFTAFAQRFAGEEIKLQPATATWREWSQQCAELAAHPAVIASRDYWLENVTSATMRLADDRVTERPRARDTTRVSSSLTTDQTAEVDDARRRSTRTMDAILLGALSRTLAQVIGEGVVAVDLDGAGRSVLKPDVDLRRSVGWFTTIYPVPLTCATEKHTGAIELLDSVHQTLSAVPHYGIGYGLLRYLFAPTARHLAANPHTGHPFLLPRHDSGAAGRRWADRLRLRDRYARAGNDSGPRPCRRSSGVPLLGCAARRLVVRHPPCRAGDG